MPNDEAAQILRASLKSVTILMADDDADDRQLTKEAFEEAKLANDLRFVEDGQDCSTIFTAAGNIPTPQRRRRRG